MGFQQGLSGLNTSAKALEAIGNNISNSGTVGFKSAVTQFADVYAASLSGGGVSAIGIGSSIAGVKQQFTQGNINTTNNGLDMAINGNGFFRLQSASGDVSYTRNGQFQLDKSGFIVNSSGSQLTGYLANAQGIIVQSTPAAVQINTAALAPMATGSSASKTGLQIGLNLDSRKLAPAASVAGTQTGTATPDTAIANLALGPQSFSATINGYSTGLLTLPVGTYTASTLASALQTQINNALPAGTSVSVSTNASGFITLTATPGGVGSTAALVDMNIGSGAVNVGTVNSNPGYSFAVDVGGTPYSVTLPTGNYTTASSVAAAVQSAINAQMPTGTSVSVTLSSSGSLAIGGVANGANVAVTLTDSLGALDGAASGGAGGFTAGTLVADVYGAGGATQTTGADNFSVTNPLSYTSSTSATVYDSLGNSHLLGIYFVKAALPNQYNVYTNMDGGPPSAATTINFSSTGVPNPITAFTIPQSFTVTTGAAAPLTFNLDLTNSTQYGNSFSVNSVLQDGYASGTLSGLSVSADGTVQGKYSNGQSRNLAQVVLTTFRNPNGLQNLGGNRFAETSDSGQPLIGTPGSGSNGVIQASSVEESNTDLTAALVDMITQQRAYQANAQTIKTEDSIMQTLVNLR